MKGSIVAAAAALLGGASASVHHRHDIFHKRGAAVAAANETEVCVTYTTTSTGSLIWTPVPECTKNCPVATTKTSPPEVVVKTTKLSTTSTTKVTKTPSTTPVPAATTTVPATVTTEVPCTVPTIVVETCPTPGTYTFPATTVVVTETTTVCGGSTTQVPSGTHTLGGVTTVVETATTVTCPVATTTTAPGGVVTSVIETTTYVCPSAGTYTIAPVTTTCTVEEIVIVPVVTSFTPGTYTKPAVTTTVTETDYVVYCPFDVPTPTTAAAKTTTPAVVVSKPKTTTAPAVVVATTSKKTTSAAAKTTSTAAKASATVTTPKLGGTGDQWAITYTPYTTTGECKTKAAVLTDLQEIKGKGFTTIRVYSTDCDTLPNVGAGCEATGLKLIIGVFIGEVGCDNGNPDVASQVADIKAWARWDLVELVVVGNEAGQNGYCTPSQLSALVTEVKTIIVEAGCDVPVTTTDTVNTWQNAEFASALCAVVDVVACNAHAYFNAETTPAEAGTFVAGQLQIVKDVCGGDKEGYVLESGWPSSCEPNGVAVCSTEDQAEAISSLKAELGASIVFFSYSDDDWKDNGSCECEQHWGCGQLF